MGGMEERWMDEQRQVNTGCTEMGMLNVWQDYYTETIKMDKM
jgi:hypothetical protein